MTGVEHELRTWRGPLVASMAVVAFAAASTGTLYSSTFARPVPLIGFTTAAALVATSVSAATDSMLARGGRASPAGWAATAAASLLGAVCFCAALLVRSARPLTVLDVVVSGWARIFSAPTPVPNRAELLVVPVLHVWATATALAILARRQAKPSSSLAVLIAASALAMLCAAPTEPALASVALVVAGALAILLEHARRRRHANHAFAVTRALGTAAAAMIIAVAVAAAPAARRPLSVRSPEDTPLETVRGLSPLAELKAHLTAQPPVDLFDVTGALPGPLVKLATLERYDGTQWTVDGRFQETASLPAAKAVARSGPGRTYQVTVEQLSGRWVPIAGAATQVAGIDTRHNTATGDILAEQALTATQTYRVTATNPPQPGAGETLRPSVESRYAALLRTDGISSELAEQLDALLAGGATPGERLDGMRRGLVERFGYSIDAPAGHQDALLNAVLTQRHSGSPEQFAALAALGARRAGFPSRVVVGWRITTDPTATRSANPADTPEPVVVRSDQTYAWIEVATENLGWVALDVTPPKDQTQPLIEDPTAAAGADTAQPVTPTTRPDLLKADPTPADEGSSLLSDVVHNTMLFGPPALLIAVLSSIWLIKQQRRRTRASAAHPADRVLGAWDELLDRLIETGRPADPAQTAVELGHTLSATVPDVAAALGPLATLVGAAIHAPDLIADHAADQAWQHSDTACTALRRAHSSVSRPYRPILRVFDPRPLVLNHARRT